MEWDVFTAQPLLAHATGFALFGPWHLCWLAVCAVVIALVLRSYRVRERKLAGSGTLVMRVAAATALGLLISDDLLMQVSGVFTPEWWPLHLCNFAEYLCLIYAIHPNRPCRELLLTLGIPGAAAAMLFPGWTSCPPYTWPAICGFLEHALIFSVSLCAEDNPETTPRLGELWESYAFVAAYALFFRWFNARMGTNFGFLNAPAYGSPLEWLYEVLGDPGYLVPYAAGFAALALVLHLVMAARRAAQKDPGQNGS